MIVEIFIFFLIILGFALMIYYTFLIHPNTPTRSFLDTDDFIDFTAARGKALQSWHDQVNTTCECCNGKGYIVSAMLPGWEQEKWICECCNGTGRNR